MKIFKQIILLSFFILSHSKVHAETLDTFMRKVFRAELANQMNVPETEFEVHFDNLRTLPVIDSTKKINFANAKVFGFGTGGAKRMEGLFRVSLVVKNGQTMNDYTVSGVAKIIGPVLVAKQNILRGHLVQSSDVQTIKMPWKTLMSASMALSSTRIIERRAKNYINKGDAFSEEDLDSPVAINAGENIELTVLAGPGVIVRSRAVAKQEGRVGDFIRLEHADTKKIITGLVTGLKTAEVRL